MTTDPIEFVMYDDGAPVEHGRWTSEALPHIRGWMASGEVDFIDVDTRAVLALDADDLTPELLMSGKVALRATGSVAEHMRHSGLFADEREGLWRIAMRDALLGKNVAAFVNRLDQPVLERQPPCAAQGMPDLRLHLLSGWNRPTWRAGARMGVTRARAMHTVHENHPMSLSRAVDYYIGYELRTLRESELWWIGPDMCDLLYLTASKIPLDVRQEHFDLPSPNGLVVFAKPWTGGHDAVKGDEHVVVDAITWGHANIGATEGNGQRIALSVSHYRLLRFEEGMTHTELQLASNVGAWEEARRRLLGVSDGRAEYALSGEAWAPLGRSDWPAEHAIGDVDEYIDPALDKEDPARVAYIASLTEDRRLIAALAMLLNTKTIATLEEGHLPRQARRRSQRAGVPADVKVVVLRRPDRPHDDQEPEDSDKPPVEWSHRWIVNAHPRLQPYGPGRTLRRLIMVPPHVKGPEDKPLVVKETVKAWVK